MVASSPSEQLVDQFAGYLSPAAKKELSGMFADVDPRKVSAISQHMQETKGSIAQKVVTALYQVPHDSIGIDSDMARKMHTVLARAADLAVKEGRTVGPRGIGIGEAQKLYEAAEFAQKSAELGPRFQADVARAKGYTDFVRAMAANDRGQILGPQVAVSSPTALQGQLPIPPAQQASAPATAPTQPQLDAATKFVDVMHLNLGPEARQAAINGLRGQDPHILERITGSVQAFIGHDKIKPMAALDKTLGIMGNPTLNISLHTALNAGMEKERAAEERRKLAAAQPTDGEAALAATQKEAAVQQRVDNFRNQAGPQERGAAAPGGYVASLHDVRRQQAASVDPDRLKSGIYKREVIDGFAYTGFTRDSGVKKMVIQNTDGAANFTVYTNNQVALHIPCDVAEMAAIKQLVEKYPEQATGLIALGMKDGPGHAGDRILAAVHSGQIPADVAANRVTPELEAAHKHVANMAAVDSQPAPGWSDPGKPVNTNATATKPNDASGGVQASTVGMRKPGGGALPTDRLAASKLMGPPTA